MTCLPLVLFLAAIPCVVCPQDTLATRFRPPAEVNASVSYESLTGGMSDWTEASVRVQVGVATGSIVHAEVVRTERFDLMDAQLRLGASVPLARAWIGHGEVAVSPTGHVLPDLSVAASISRRLGGGWVVGLGGRHDAHDVGAVDIGTLLADYYVGDFLLGYALSVAFVDGASAPGHRGSLSRYYGNGSAVTVLASAGQSAERVRPQELLVTDVVALALWGVHWVGPRLGLTYGAAFNRHVDLYDRRRGEMGVRLRM